MAVRVCLGQNGAMFEGEARRLSKTISLSSTASSSVVYESSELAPAYCWAASYNRGNEIDYLVDNVFSILEQQDFVTGIDVVSDGTQGLGAGLSSGLLQELRDLLPSHALRSTFISPLTPGKSSAFNDGVGALNLLLAAHYALVHADCVMLRSLNDSFQLCAQDTGASGNTSLRDAHAVIAGDLLLCTGPRCAQGWADPWPLVVCGSSPRSKLVDVRSSLWRTTQGASKAKLASEGGHSPLRAMAANLHALHLTSPLPQQQQQQRQPVMTVSSAAMRLAVPDAKEGRLRLERSPCLQPDVTVALDWACPRVMWPSGLGRQPQRDRSGLTADEGKSRGSSSSSSGGGSGVVAIAFSSPYALLALQDLGAACDDLLLRRAFVHNFEEFGVEAAELRIALDFLRCSLR